MSQQEFEGILNSLCPDYSALYAANGVDFFSIYKALCKRESDFDPNADMNEVNVGDHSLGYMQVRIATARWVRFWWLKTDDQIKTLLLDPKENIITSIKYMTWQLKRYGWDIYKSTCAYNAGSYIVNKGVCINASYGQFVLAKYDYYLSGGK